MEVQIPDAGWLNGPTQLILLQEFSLAMFKHYVAKLEAQLAAEQHPIGQYA